MKGSLARLALIVGLLLLHFYIRTHHLLTLPPYVDEGYHLKRAALVWNFEQNPGRFAHGKVLLYFWLGLFESDPLSALPAGCMAIAIWSLISGATLYQIGRLLHDHATGILALFIYAVLPLAFFFERMALADPFASGFACLLIWRSLVWVRRPTLSQGVLLGLLIGCMTLAKLTTALLPAFPLILALRSNQRRQYVPSLLVAGLVAALLWSPLVIPALTAPGDFILVNTENVRALTSPTRYLTHALRLVAEFTTAPVLIALLPAIFIAQRRAAVILWILLLGIVPVLAAGVVTARYLMPLAAPLSILWAAAAVRLWKGRQQRIIRLALIGVAGFWLITFVQPFMLAAHHSPINLPFRGDDVNAYEYLSGELSANDTVWAAAEMVNTRTGRFYASWDLCHLLYFYTRREITCVEHDLPSRVLADLAPGESAYVLLEASLSAEPIAVYQSPTSTRQVTLWKMSQK